MANALDLLKNNTARVLIVGYPGAGKTGAICSLLDAGLKVRVICYDKIGNMTPLLKFTKPEMLKNLDIVLLEDKVRGGQKLIETSGLPTAFAEGFKLLDSWKYQNQNGEYVDLGSSKNWGPDTVVVLDGLTSQGDASMRRALAVANRTPLNCTQAVWGHAMKDQGAFLDRLLSSHNNHHVVVLSHLKMIGPKDIERDDSDVTKEIKKQLVDLVPTRLFPSALGRDLPQTIAGKGFNAILLAERVQKGGKTSRWLTTDVGEELDTKMGSIDLPSKLPIENGLRTVFEALTGGPAQWFAQSNVNNTQEENTHG